MYRRLFLAIALLVAAAPGARADDPDSFKEPHITVDGAASLDMRPDRATMRLGVVSEKPTAAEAAADIAKSSAAVVETLKGLGVEAKDIKTYSLDIDPITVDDRDPQTKAFVKRTLAGYKASTLLEVNIRDVAKAGALAGRVLEAGANFFQGLTFDVSDREEQSDRLRAKAVGDAMRRAALYASGAKMKLGRLLALNPDLDARGNEAALPTRKSALGASPAHIVIPVEPGMEHLGVHVSGTWELLPE